MLDYSSGETDDDEQRKKEFETVNDKQKELYLMELWRICYLKAMGSAMLKRVFYKLHTRVINYGTTKNIQLEQIKVSKYILMPENEFKRWWSLIMLVLLMYVATYVPYNICFNLDPRTSQHDRWGFIVYLDLLVDIFFTCDIVVTFMSAYEDTTAS